MPQSAAPRLLPTSWTSAGDATPQSPDERSPIPLRERIEAVAAGGWNGFGVVHDDLVEFQRTGSLTDLRALLRDNGIDHLELEFLGDWWTSGERRERSDLMRRELLIAAEELGAKTVKIGWRPRPRSTAPESPSRPCRSRRTCPASKTASTSSPR
jgi:sugar phosphate isomerase/epimerase